MGYTVHFENAKNGELTCKINDKYLHSKYSPTNEAKTFVNNIDCSFNPAVIFVVGAGLPYCFSYLKARFPLAIVATIQCTKDFLKYDTSWDTVFYLNDNEKNLSEKIFSTFGEDKLFSTLCISWNPSLQIFAEKTQRALKAVLKSIAQSKDLLITRTFFNKRWTLNTLRFFTFLHSVATIKTGTQSVFIAASGPSLKDSMPFIKRNRKKIFLVAVSSSCNYFIENNIFPDVAISTDGGYYAKKHLECLIDKNIPIMLSAESAFPAKLLEQNKVIPLCYNDGLEAELFSMCGIPHVGASRNGTVSGTAVSLFLKLSNGPILLGGLDLCTNKNFVHVNPNKLELLDSLSDNRFLPLSTRTVTNSFNSTALEIYRSWFEGLPSNSKNRLFRIFSEPSNQISLAGIKDITVNQADLLVSKNFTPFLLTNKKILNHNIMNKKLLSYFVNLKKDFEQKKNIEKNRFFIESVSLVDLLLAEKYPNNNDYLLLAITKTEHFINQLINKLNRIMDTNK